MPSFPVPVGCQSATQGGTVERSSALQYHAFFSVVACPSPLICLHFPRVVSVILVLSTPSSSAVVKESAVAVAKFPPPKADHRAKELTNAGLYIERMANGSILNFLTESNMLFQTMW